MVPVVDRNRRSSCRHLRGAREDSSSCPTRLPHTRAASALKFGVLKESAPKSGGCRPLDWASRATHRQMIREARPPTLSPPLHMMRGHRGKQAAWNRRRSTLQEGAGCGRSPQAGGRLRAADDALRSVARGAEACPTDAAALRPWLVRVPRTSARMRAATKTGTRGNTARRARRLALDERDGRRWIFNARCSTRSKRSTSRTARRPLRYFDGLSRRPSRGAPSSPAR